MFKIEITPKDVICYHKTQTNMKMFHVAQVSILCHTIYDNVQICFKYASATLRNKYKNVR